MQAELVRIEVLLQVLAETTPGTAAWKRRVDAIKAALDRLGR